MNDELEKLLQNILGAPGAYDTEKGELVKKEVADMYDNKLKLWRYIIWALLAVNAIIMAVAISVFSFSSNTKVLIACAAITLFAFEDSILMKLWYWQMNTKYAVLKEVTELKLQIAQLGEKKEEA